MAKTRRGKGNNNNASSKPERADQYRDDRRGKSGRDDQRKGSNYQGDKLSSLNDVSWYTRNPILTQTAGSFPFPYRPGMELPVGSNPNTGMYTIPGSMALRWIPSVGPTQYPTDPANIAGKELYAKVREKFSGSIEADAPDFVIYLMALDSIYSYIGSLKRLYRLLRQYSPDNYFMPAGLFQTLGFSYTAFEEILSDRMLLCQNINELVGMTKKFHCPAVFDLFNRHYWLNDNVYTDAPTIDSQFYVFLQAGYYKFTKLNTPDGVEAGGLQLQQAPFSATTGKSLCQTLFEFGLGLIRALAESDDGYLISGYLSRAFEGTPDFSVDYLAIDEEFKPVYQEEVLSQIENASWVANTYVLPPVTATNISQDPKTNSVLCSMVVGSSDAYYSQYVVAPITMNSRHPAPTAADCVIMTRLKSFCEQVTTEVGLGLKMECGTELVLSATIYRFIPKRSTSKPGLAQAIYMPYLVTLDKDTTLGQAIDVAGKNSYMAAFDWHPLTWTAVNTTESGVTISNGYLANGDTHNITVITGEQMKNLNRVCVYSEFNAFGIL